MSELRIVKLSEMTLIKLGLRNDKLYFKDEVDKVIAHNKYKRCLAMAKWCESEGNRLEVMVPIFDTDKECWEYNSDYWQKWYKRWLELAEQFKEAE